MWKERRAKGSRGNAALTGFSFYCFPSKLPAPFKGMQESDGNTHPGSDSEKRIICKPVCHVTILKFDRSARRWHAQSQ